MKKITIFSLHLSFGGIEKCVSNLANLLCDDYEVEIVSTYKIGKPAFKINDKVKVRYLIDKYTPNREEWKESVRKFKVFKFFKETYHAIMCLTLRKIKTVEAMKKCDSDIMISTRVLFNKWLGNYGRSGAYKIGWEHNHHHNDMDYANDVVKSCKKLDSLVLVSDSLRSFYKKLMKENNIKCRCIYIPNMLNDIPTTINFSDEKRIVSVGRLAKEKGFTDLIDLFYEFHKTHSDWHLDLIGDGALKNKIVDRVYQYGLTNSVTVHGYLKKEDINEIFKKSSFYVMTSYTESFGLVLIEAMSFGLPCLAYTSAEGANDLITDGKTGYLISNRDSSIMLEKMHELASNDSLRKTMGNDAYQFSLNYDSDKVKKDWINLINKRG